MAIEEYLKRNREFVASGGFDRPTLSGDGPLLLLAPSSPLLSAGLELAFGLRPGEAVVIQLPGAWSGGEERALLRAVALAVHLHGCREVLVVGLEGDPLCPPPRGQVRQAVQASGLSPGSPELEQLQELLNGPSSPAAGVLETVRLLRSSAAVPAQVPVHGCLLSATTGQASLIEVGRARGAQAAARARVHARDRDEEDGERRRPRRRAGFDAEADEERPSRAATTGAARVTPPPVPTGRDATVASLPEIALPEIPPLDLSALNAPPPAAKPAPGKKASDYGRGEGSGPVSMEALQKLDVPAVVTLSGPSTQGTQIQLPEAVSVADTGLGDLSRFLPGTPLTQAAGEVAPPVEVQESRPHVEAAPDVRPAADVSARPPARPKPLKAVKPPQAPPRPPPRRAAGTRLDLHRGVVDADGQERSLDPELHRALLKVAGFLAQEMQAEERGQLAVEIQRAAGVGEPTGELLKRVISPVLKMGKKRYAVINELLKMKEDLPRLPAATTEAILLGILQRP